MARCSADLPGAQYKERLRGDNGKNTKTSDQKFRAMVIDDIDDLAELSGAWNELLLRSSANTVFLTWDWLYSWARTYLDASRTLFVVAVCREGELVALAPWYIQSLRAGGMPLKELRFLGTPEAGSDYLDVIIRKGQEQKVTRFLYELLLHEKASRWDSCLLQDISANSLFLLHFLNLIEDAGKYAELRPGSFCPAVSLPQKGEDLFSLYDSHRRLQYRRHLKLLQKVGDLKHETIRGKQVGRSIDVFCDLYELRNRNHIRTLRPFLAEYAAGRAGQATLQVDLLSSRGTLIAGLVHLRYGDTLGMYLMAIDREFHPHISLGNVFIGMCLGAAIEEGIAVYDFLKGTEPYKFHWADGGHSLVSLSHYQKKIVPLLAVTGRFLKYTAKTVLR